MKNVTRFCVAMIVTLMASHAYSACSKQPIVFVHGYSGSANTFNTMANKFKNAGWPNCAIYKFSYDSIFSSNKKSADELKSYIQNVKRESGWNKVNVVAHSNGGLVARWFRQFDNGKTLNDDLVAIGTPHKGTTWALACAVLSPACREMIANSSFLRDLNGKGCDVSIWSDADEIIIPNSSAKCGSNKKVRNQSHNGMLTNNNVFNKVKGNI